MTSPLDAELMDGATLSRNVLEECRLRGDVFTERAGRRPRLAAVLVGSDPASVTYVRMKQARCLRVGVASVVVELPESATTKVVVGASEGLSEDPEIDGILLQHPVPEGVGERAAFEAIASTEDVDGVTKDSFTSMAFGLPGFASCTPAGIMRLLDEYGVDPGGKHAVVIGRSPILGKPIGMLLLARDGHLLPLTNRGPPCDRSYRRHRGRCPAVGRPRFVRGDWIKSGAVVSDAGYNEGNVGDVSFATAVSVAGLITPVPGGVGPTTIALLIEQTVAAAEKARSAPTS